ncbi:MAG TPA: hypothetical protein VGJ48_26335 [Pyrinomonadaceae bacterium]|jgi:hypothetical protein
MDRSRAVKKQENIVENITSELNRLAQFAVFILNALGSFRGRFPFPSPSNFIHRSPSLTQSEQDLLGASRRIPGKGAVPA